MSDDNLKRFLDQLWQDNYNDLLNALGMRPQAIQEPSDCRTFVFADEVKAKAACDALNKIPAVKANLNGKKVSTVQPESITDQVVQRATTMGGKMKGFQLSWA